VTLALRVKAAHVRSLPLTDAVINTVDPDIAKIHRLVRRALHPADTAPSTPTPSTTAGGSPTPKPSPSPEQGGQPVDVNQVC
jgi:hypothetical protein